MTSRCLLVGHANRERHSLGDGTYSLGSQKAEPKLINQRHFLRDVSSKTVLVSVKRQDATSLGERRGKQNQRGCEPAWPGGKALG